MKRRTLLSLTAVGLVMPGSVIAGGGHVDYSRAAFDKALASGEPLLLDFFAPW